MQLTLQQQKVLDNVKAFFKSDASIFIIRGYAGTGKTTMIKAIADYVHQNVTVFFKLMAPTGRAALVLSKKTNYLATTIHTGIYGPPKLNIEEKEEASDTKIMFRASIKNRNNDTVFIIDEASMVSSVLARQETYSWGTDILLEDLITHAETNYGGKIIFVGDPAQLPPVGDRMSNALNPEYFERNGLKVMTAELTEVLRQDEGSLILDNAMHIRDLLSELKRNRLVFQTADGDVERIEHGKFLDKYFDVLQRGKNRDCVVIAYTNKAVAHYNRKIRSVLYNEAMPAIREGDVLMVVQNNYCHKLMNGEFVVVESVGETITQSAPVYVDKAGKREKEIVTLNFQHITIKNDEGRQIQLMILLDLLNNDNASLSSKEITALYINFRIRRPELNLKGDENTGKFYEALLNDPFYNCLRVKYGYAVSGHKCQGGEWPNVFVDYDGRTGLNDDCLRWAYTSTTRASRILYFTNLPGVTQFSKFKIDKLQQCSKINEECMVLGEVSLSPYHDSSCENYLHAKCNCIISGMEFSPYKVHHVESKPYQEIYYIDTPDGIERYDIRYKKGGVFLKTVPQKTTEHSFLVSMIMDNEREMPLVFNYTPSDDVHRKLYELIRHASDTFSVQITNVVEHKEDYSVVYYFRTSGTNSYLKVYINDQGFVTYAKPMSLIGVEDQEFKILLDYIINLCE